MTTAPRRILLATLMLVAGVFATAAHAAPRHVSTSSYLLPSTGGAQLEGALVVDPKQPAHLAVLGVDYSGYVTIVPGVGEQARVGPAVRLFLSRDGGRHWSTKDVGGHLPDQPYLSVSNPSLAQAHGVLYATWLSNDGQAWESAVQFARFDWSGRNLGTIATLSTPAVGPAAAADKPWVTVSPDGKSVTVAWTLFPTAPGEYPQVAMRSSADGGTTFAPMQVASDLTPESLTSTSGATLATPLYLSAGRLVVAWHATAALNGGTDAIRVDPAGGSGADAIALRNVAASGSDGTYPRHPNQPSLAVDRRTGRLYLVAGVQTDGGVRTAVVSSTDRGQTWSKPRFVAPASGHVNQLNAAVAVEPDGVVGVVFQQVVGTKMTTVLAVDDNKKWSTSTISDHATGVAPYTTTSNGTPIGDFLTMTGVAHGFVTVYPEGSGKSQRLRFTHATWR